MTEEQTPPSRPVPSRRAVLTGAGAAALAVLGGCATYDQSAPPPVEEAPPVEEPAAEAPDDPKDDGDEPEKEPEGPPPIVASNKVPVGGGVVLEGKRLVVTQPAKGQFKCFTAVCTHAGCVVADVGGGTINCTCHGSKFKIADGSVARGPAGRPLREVKIKVKDDGIVLA